MSLPVRLAVAGAVTATAVLLSRRRGARQRVQPVALRPSSQLQDKQQEAPQQLDAPPSRALPGRARLFIALLISLLATLLATCAAAASVWRGSVDVAAVMVLAWCLVILQKVMRGHPVRANSRSRLPVGLTQCAVYSTHIAGDWDNTVCIVILSEGCVSERACRPQLHVASFKTQQNLAAGWQTVLAYAVVWLQPQHPAAVEAVPTPAPGMCRTHSLTALGMSCHLMLLHRRSQ